jgi:hypothetical protein
MKTKRHDHGEIPLLINLQEQLIDIKLRVALMEAARLEDEASENHHNALPADSPERVAERQFHEKMDQKILLLIRKLQRKQRNKRIIHVARKAMRFAAAVFLIGCIGLGTAMAVSSQVRVTVMKLLYNITPQYTEIQLVPDDTASFNVPADWTGDYYPSYIPNEYEFHSIQVMESIRTAYYTSGKDKALIFHENDEDVKSNIDTEGYDVKTIELNGHVALLAIKEGKSVVVWQVEKKFLYLTIPENEEIALKVAKGVKRIN